MNPTNPTVEIVKGAHCFITQVIQGKQEAPSKAVLISLFNGFVDGQIKDYIYNKIKKPILLELALCILQEIGTHGIEHAKSLKQVKG